MIRWLTIILLAVLPSAGNVYRGDDTWKFFKPSQTTEQSVIQLFGTPDVVEIRCQYDDIKRANISDRKVAIQEYGLEYNRLRGDLNILKGPLGEASSVEVKIADGTAWEVDWIYSGRYRPSAEQLWRNDKTFHTTVGQAGGYTSIGMKTLPDSCKLFINCFTGAGGKCDGDITVMLMPPSGNKE